jgi:hypothetical protein
MHTEVVRPPRGPWYTALVRAPSIAVGLCALATLITGAGPLAWLAGLPFAPALAAVHATEDGVPPRRVLLLAAVALLSAVIALLAIAVALLLALEILLGPAELD